MSTINDAMVETQNQNTVKPPAQFATLPQELQDRIWRMTAWETVISVQLESTVRTQPGNAIHFITASSNFHKYRGHRGVMLVCKAANKEIRSYLKFEVPRSLPCVDCKTELFRSSLLYIRSSDVLCIKYLGGEHHLAAEMAQTVPDTTLAVHPWDSIRTVALGICSLPWHRIIRIPRFLQEFRNLQCLIIVENQMRSADRLRLDADSILLTSEIKQPFTTKLVAKVRRVYAEKQASGWVGTIPEIVVRGLRKVGN